MIPAHSLQGRLGQQSNKHRSFITSFSLQIAKPSAFLVSFVGLEAEDS